MQTLPATNLKPHKLMNLSMPISRTPMETICMDLIGPLPETSSGNKFALTAICLLTNYVFMIPIPNKMAQQVIHAHLCPIWGQQVHSN